MSQGEGQLKQGQALTRFLFSEEKAERFGEFYTGEPSDPQINYQFRNGAGPEQDSFIRRVFLETQSQRNVDISQVMHCHHMTYTGNSDTVSFSDFRHLPFYVQRWLTVDLQAPTDGDYAFCLETCGGARIWVENKLQACFTPYTRNEMQALQIKLTLNAGKNRLYIHLDELFERDTLFMIRLTYLDSAPLEVSLPGLINKDADILTGAVHSMRVELAARDHQVRIHCSEPCQEAVHLSGELRGMGNDNFTPRLLDFGEYLAGQPLLILQLPQDVGEAHYQLNLTLTRQGFSISRLLGINVMPEHQVKATGETLSARKYEALRYTANHGMERTCRLLAMMHLGEYSPESEYLLLSSLKRISAREDCSDFSLVPLLWIWQFHRGTHFPQELWRRVKSTILGYRYWLDETGCDVMWFWSENHALCFHTAQYLAGQFFPDECFVSSGRLGREQRDLARQRLTQWFDAIEEHGFVEWNSAPYYPVDYIGLFALYQMADDESIRQRAHKLIDRLMLQSALHYQQGIATGTMGRVYEKELLAGILTELSAYGAVAWGQGFYNRKCASLPLFCASDYQPPALSEKYAKIDKQALSAWYHCGGGDICVWKAADVVLSSCVDHATGKRGHQQHLVDLQFAARFDAKVWINHPGEAEPSGEKRPSFWAGNALLPRVMQVKNRAMLYWPNIPETLLPWTHVHLPEAMFDQVIGTEYACVVKSGAAFAAIVCSVPLQVITTGLTAQSERRAYAREVAWFIEVEHGDSLAFERFCERVAEYRFEIDQVNSEACLQDKQGREIMTLNANGYCCSEGKSHVFPTLSHNELCVVYEDTE